MSSESSHNNSAFTIDTSNPDVQGLMSMVEAGISPKMILRHLAPSFRAPPGADEMMLWRLIITMIDPPTRKKLPQYNTIQDAVELISKSKKIMVLSGAGVSTSAGLPDFRSRDGIYVQIHAQHPDLDDPKLMFDIEYFRKNPLPFYQFAKALYPGQYKPTIGHKFIKCVEEHNKLLRNYSQNIDTLEKQAGIKRVVECHGSFAKATCTNCKYCVDGDEIRADILNQRIPLCPKCHAPDGVEPSDNLGIMKPNIVFFGEQLGNEFHNSLELDKEQVDLLVVIGSSLKVKPVALIPRSVPSHVPQILINKEPLEHVGFDIELLGNCDDIIQEICLRLGGEWLRVCEPNKRLLTELTGITTINRLSGGTSSSNQSGKLSKTSVKEIRSTESRNGSTSENTTCKVSEFKGHKSETEGGSQDEVGSCKSNQATIATESAEQDMVDIDDPSATTRSDPCAMPNCDHDSEDEWEDVEILASSDDSSGNFSENKAEIEIPESCFIFIGPNKYLFSGAELTKSQLDSYTKE